jgi:predicted small secreted protein
MSENLFEPQSKESLMKSFTALLVVSGLLALAGCNTVKGVGQDLQKAGSAIEGAAKKN